MGENFEPNLVHLQTSTFFNQTFRQRSSYSLPSICGSYEKIVYRNDTSKLCGRRVNSENHADHHVLLSGNQKQAWRFVFFQAEDGIRDPLPTRSQALRSMIFSDKLLNLPTVRETGSVNRYDNNPLARESSRSVKKSAIQARSNVNH